MSLRTWLRKPWLRFANQVVQSSTNVQETVRSELPSALRATPGLSRFEPVVAKANTVIVPPPRGREAGDRQVPVPPASLWRNGEPSAEAYLDDGRRDTQVMQTALAARGRPFETAGAVLDFGCATGRITRHVMDMVRPDCEVWGVDIHAPSINWCMENLSPPCNFFTSTTTPHLPFRDGYFDVVIAASVLDTMSELRDAWLLELRRVLAPDGALYLTLIDRQSLDIALNVPPDHRLAAFAESVRRADREVGFLEGDWATVTLQREQSTAAHVLYDLEHFRTTWGHTFDIGEAHAAAYAGFETGFVLIPQTNDRRIDGSTSS